MSRLGPEDDPTPVGACPDVADVSSGERAQLRESTPTHLPLLLVVVSLILAVLLPRIFQPRMNHRRDTLERLAGQARARVDDIQLDLALEAAAERAFLLTGMAAFARELTAARLRRQATERELLADVRFLAPRGSTALPTQVQRLQSLDERFDSVVFADAAVGRASGARQMAAHRQTGIIQALADSLTTGIRAATRGRRAELARMETVAALLTGVLGLLCLGAVVLVARLGSRFRTVALRLDESEARFRQIADNLSSVIWLSEPSFPSRLLYVSAAYERIWGRSRASLYANPASILDAVHADDRERVRRALPDVARGLGDLEFRVVRPDGDVRRVWSRAFPVRDRQGRTFRVAGVMADITERWRHAQERDRLLEAEQRARAAAERDRSALERVTRSREQLIRGFTHDVKNPLGVADGYLSLLEQGLLGPVADRHRETLGKARWAIGQSLELIAQLLDIARAEAGKLPVTPRATDPVALIREVAETSMPQAEERRVSVRVELPPALPTLQTDPVRIRQIVGNLVSNAIKYTQAGGHVVVGARLEPDGAPRQPAITVADDGPGIPEEKLPYLFLEFTRFDARAAEGAGIGLAISQKIAGALGGEITVRSEVGKGSVFTLHLPLAPAARRVA